MSASDFIHRPPAPAAARGRAATLALASTRGKAILRRRPALRVALFSLLLMPLAVGTACRRPEAPQPARKSVIDVPALDDLVSNRGPVEDWGCSGLFCECEGSADSPTCKIVAPYCVDHIICIGDDCSCVWGGGP